jgi:hypothetical protein
MAGTDGYESRPLWPAYFAFAALAMLAGPVDGYAANVLLIATNAQLFAGMAVPSLVGGGGLIAFALLRRERLPGGRDWGVLLLLLAPQWCSVGISSLAGSVTWLDRVGDGVVFLLSLAAPLWLGLVAAMEIVQIEVPAACVAAAIAGMGAVLLVIPSSSYSLRWPLVPMLLMEIVLGIATVITWAIAHRRLSGCPITGMAGGYLLLSGMGNVGCAWLNERGSWRPLDLHALVWPVLAEAVLLAVVWCLWFWLLQRITLGAFGMRALAAWAATALPAFVTVGFSEWRVDAAFAIAVAAVATALRARVTDEQPTALGLRTP